MSHSHRHGPAWARAASLRAFVLLFALAFGATPLARAAGIAITQPANEEAIHSNLGDVLVNVQAPGAAPGSCVRLFADGAEQPRSQFNACLRCAASSAARMSSGPSCWMRMTIWWPLHGP